MADKRSIASWGLAAAFAVCCAAAGRPVDETAPAAPEPAPQHGPYMRARQPDGERLVLEVSARTFAPPQAEGGPEVTLVSVSHIAEQSLYDQVQGLLDRHDLVLYESVKPAGTGAARGETDDERAAATKATMDFLAGVLAAHHRATETYPPGLDALRDFGAARDPRLGQWLADARQDGWGRPLAYALAPDGSFVISSLGADGRPGGEGAAADLEVTSRTPVEPEFLEGNDDNLQSELAKALGLAFQLDGIDYDRPHFQCSDMSMDELERALEAEGVDFAPLEGSLAGSSLPGRLVIFFLRLVRAADAFFDGAIADALKVMLIEMFSDERFLEQSLKQYGPGLGKVLIDQRNQLVVDDLRAALRRSPDLNSIAILYGAGHMPDLGQRLETQLGYRPVSEQWLTAIEVNLAESTISPAQMRSIRAMIRSQMQGFSR